MGIAAATIAAGVTAATSIGTAASSMFGGKGGKTQQAMDNPPKMPSGGAVNTPGTNLSFNTDELGNVITNTTAGPGTNAYYGQMPQYSQQLNGLMQQFQPLVDQWGRSQGQTTGQLTSGLTQNLGAYQGALGGALGGYQSNLGAATNSGLTYNNMALGTALGGYGAAGANYDQAMRDSMYAPLNQYNARARAGMSTLKDSLNQRQILGSSFANDDLSRANAEYGLGAGTLSAQIAQQDFNNRMGLTAAQTGAITNAGNTAYNVLGNQATGLYGAQNTTSGLTYQSGAQTTSDIFNAQTGLNQGTLSNNLMSLDQQKQAILNQVNMVTGMANMDLANLGAATGTQNAMVGAIADYSKAMVSDASKIQAASAQGTGMALGSALGGLSRTASASPASTGSSSGGGIGDWIKGLFSSGPQQLSGPGMAGATA